VRHVLIPHLEGFPLSELGEELQLLDLVVGLTLLEPVRELEVVAGPALHVLAEPVARNGVILLHTTLLLLLLDRLVLHDAQLVGVVLVGATDVDELLDVREILQDEFDVVVELGGRPLEFRGQTVVAACPQCLQQLLLRPLSDLRARLEPSLQVQLPRKLINNIPRLVHLLFIEPLRKRAIVRGNGRPEERLTRLACREGRLVEDTSRVIHVGMEVEVLELR